jgi:hypothetical protein
MRSRALPGLVVLLACALAACASGSEKATGVTRVSASPSSDEPLGLIAIGHSGLTGYASDPSRLMSSARENSWATGTNPAVASIYLRMVRAEPQMKGHVANTAVNGSKASSLLGQAQQAFATVPRPELAIIQTIDNDIACDGTDEANHAAFAQGLRDAIDAIVKQSPSATVLTFAQFGRPAGYVRAALANPDARRHFSGDGMCDGLDTAGRPVPARITALTRIIEGYEAVLSSVCKTYPQCTYTDVSKRYVDRIDLLAQGDWDHESVAGHAAWAALMWPTVATLSGFPTD